MEGSKYFESPLLYKENGFKKQEDAKQLMEEIRKGREYPFTGILESIEKKKETKNPPLLYNLAELQNDSSRYFKCSPDETLRIAQELYEKKMTTYPRTDARVLSTAVAKEITKNLSGLKKIPQVADDVQDILDKGSYKFLGKSRYVNDKQITDHYAIIPTGQGLSNLTGLSPTARQVYEIIVRRFLSIFYPAAIYQKITLTVMAEEERLFTNIKVLTQEGYLKIWKVPVEKKKEEEKENTSETFSFEQIQKLRKGQEIPIHQMEIKTGETTPPKRYNSGSIILAMENAGQLIEDEELRAQIKGSGIGTSATRAEILKKLVANGYLELNKKTQILTPTQVGEMIYEAVAHSIKQLLNPELTASWEKGLTLVAQGRITTEEYMDKLNGFVERRTGAVKGLRSEDMMQRYVYISQFYNQGKQTAAKTKKKDKIEGEREIK